EGWHPHELHQEEWRQPQGGLPHGAHQEWHPPQGWLPHGAHQEWHPHGPHQVEWDGAGSSGWKLPRRPPSKVKREKAFNDEKDAMRRELAVKDATIRELRGQLAEHADTAAKLVEKEMECLRLFTKLEAEQKWIEGYKVDVKALYEENQRLRLEAATAAAAAPPAKKPRKAA
ncbi:unnamed protein product, partial [Effrenium voratum]